MTFVSQQLSFTQNYSSENLVKKIKSFLIPFQVSPSEWCPS